MAGAGLLRRQKQGFKTLFWFLAIVVLLAIGDIAYGREAPGLTPAAPTPAMAQIPS